GADVLIEDGVVAEVGTSVRARGAETIDASNAIVMPGFVDGHRHLWHSLFRNAGRFGGEGSAEALGPHHTPDHVYAATLIGLLGAASAGITTVVDWADLPSEGGFVEAALQAHADAGLHGVIVAAPGAWGGDVRDIDRIRQIAAGAAGEDRRVAFGATDPHDPLAAGDEWAAARAAGLRIHARVGVDPATTGVAAGLAAASLLGSDVTLVHCTSADDADLEAIASTGTGVVITPSMEMTAGIGSPPLQGFIDRNIRPGLGVGSEVEAPGDIFAQMRAANSVQHATVFDLKLAGKGGIPNLLNTRQVLRYATIDGAAAVGLGDTTGSLSPGKRADVIVLRTDLPNIAPVNDPIGAVVWGMDGANIDWVFAGGRAVVAHGEPSADVGRARDLAMRAHQDVARAAGLLVDTGAER
ncbi:MAG TPA: amidohydrolase family protein, partial [Acidimicrobiia bacterium]|nr:amidohydrolase family protein [Acidimicrobiia bacterium]